MSILVALMLDIIFLGVGLQNAYHTLTSPDMVGVWTFILGIPLVIVATALLILDLISLFQGTY